MKKHSKLISGGFCAALCVFTVIGYTTNGTITDIDCNFNKTKAGKYNT